MTSSTPTTNRLSTAQTDKAVVCVLYIAPLPLQARDNHTNNPPSCGSSSGNSPVHIAAARALAELFHKHSISLVYGGGTVGLMGELARTLVSLSGPESVHGIIPEALMSYEQAGRPGQKSTPSTTARSIDEKIYGRTTVVRDMHERKRRMAEAVMKGGPGSGFVALAGGYGTLEELMEMVTWNQLGIHERAIVVFNVGGYWDGLLEWVRTSIKEGFVAEKNGEIMVEARTVEEVVGRLRAYRVSEGRLGLDWGSG